MKRDDRSRCPSGWALSSRSGRVAGWPLVNEGSVGQLVNLGQEVRLRSHPASRMEAGMPRVAFSSSSQASSFDPAAVRSRVSGQDPGGWGDFGVVTAEPADGRTGRTRSAWSGCHSRCKADDVADRAGRALAATVGMWELGTQLVAME